jgi:putative transposase
MIKNKAFVFRIFPNEEQKQFFEQTFGNVRYFYNNFIYENYKELEVGKIKPSDVKQPSVLKKTNDFLKLGDSLALCNSYLNLKDAIKRGKSKETFIAKKNKIKKVLQNSKNLPASVIALQLQKAERYGLPKFKKKSFEQSYTTNNQIPTKSNGLKQPTIRLENDLLFLPKIKTGIKIIRHRKITKNMIIKSITVRKSYFKFYEVSILVEYQSNVKLIPFKQISLDKVEGLDFSIPHKYIDSFGLKAKSQNYYRINESKISLINCKIGRNKEISKVIFANNRELNQGKNIFKLQQKLNKLNFKIKMNRKQENHLLANELLKHNDLIVLEDIDLRAMSQCLNFGKSIYDKGFGNLRNILLYKAINLGKYVIKTDRFFPSSKNCSNCGHKHSELTLKDRIFTCPQCDFEIDRDENSAINLKQEGYRILESMMLGKYAPKNRDQNKIMYELINRESNTSIEPVNSLELSCADYSALHGNNKPTLQACG